VFGHRDDVIAQDQKRDADVTLPESAFSALAGPPAKKSETDRPAPATSSPPPSTTSLSSTSVDGFSAPSANLTDPLNYAPRPFVQTPASYTTEEPADSPEDTQEKPVEAPDATDQTEAKTDMEPVELSGPNAEETNNYLDVLKNANKDAESLSDFSDVQPDAKVEEPSAPKQTSATTAPASDLLELKHAALQALSPLVSKLNLEPEERFRTLMMLIQESDDHSLLSEAHAAALAIQDEQKRAQALFDLVNEINYFTKSTETEN
jgi:hypothetical protein